MKNIYPIINLHSPSEFNEDFLIKCLSLNPKYIQLRMKDSSTEQIADTARKIITKRNFSGLSAKIIVNDNLEAALISGADGVHLGQGDMDPVTVGKKYPGLIIGLSTHTIEQIIKANLLDINYIGFGPVFPTETKKVTSPVVTDLVGKAAEKSLHEIVFIGGINKNNVEFLPSGCTIFYAMISGLNEIFAAEKR